MADKNVRNERKTRIDKENLFIITDDKNVTDEELEKGFASLPQVAE